MPSRLFPLYALPFLFACGQAPEAPSSPAPTQEGEAPVTAAGPWAIATANPLATEAGAKILRAGGSAVDAAVAVQAVLGLVEPQSSGLGGGAFMLHYDADTGEITTYDGREMAPASATTDLFLNTDGTPMGFYDAVTSGKSIGVPGAVAMLGLAHDQHGEMPWADLFADAHHLATDGFEVSPRLSFLIGRTRRLPDNEAARALYFDAAGEPLAEGAVLRNPDYARTLEMIAQGGADAFYEGEIAEAIVSAVNAQAGPGTMTLEDIATYEPVIRRTICAPYRQYEICSMGPPSSGGVTMLQILGLFDRMDADIINTPSPEAWAHYLEASRLAYADRAVYLADPRAIVAEGVTTEDVVDALIDPAYLDRACRLDR